MKSVLYVVLALIFGLRRMKGGLLNGNPTIIQHTPKKPYFPADGGGVDKSIE